MEMRHIGRSTFQATKFGCLAITIYRYCTFRTHGNDRTIYRHRIFTTRGNDRTIFFHQIFRIFMSRQSHLNQT